MYIQMYGCANYAAPICTNSQEFGFFAALFFVVFVVIGSLVMLNLFVGVISTSMEQAADELEKERLLEDEVEEISSQYSVSAESMAMYREVFGLLDVDGGGSIADEEIKLGLEAAGRTVSDNEVKRLVAEFDENEDGNVRAALRCRSIASRARSLTHRSYILIVRLILQSLSASWRSRSRKLPSCGETCLTQGACQSPGLWAPEPMPLRH